MSSVATEASIAAQPESVQTITDIHLHRRAQLFRQTWAALFPWMLVTFVTIMAYGTPHVIITPLTYAILFTIWTYPLVALVGYLVSGLCLKSGYSKQANFVLAIPASIGAFLFSMLLVPWAVFPLFVDGYLALMASCLLSTLLTGWWMRRIFRVAFRSAKVAVPPSEFVRTE